MENQKLSMKLWFPTVTVRLLYLIDLSTNEIENGAFNVLPFASLEILVIRGCKIPNLNSGAFLGLLNLKYLNLERNNLQSIESSVLAPVRNLARFDLRSCGPHLLSLNNLFDTKMIHLKYVIVSGCLLTNTINERTFSGLVNVEILSLTNNGIEEIAEGAFDIVFKTLKHLNLIDNRLKSISPDLFIIARDGFVDVLFDNNPWYCDYRLEELRKFMDETNTYRLNGIVCDKPDMFKGKPLSGCTDLSEIVVEEKQIVGLTGVVTAASGGSPANLQQAAQSLIGCKTFKSTENIEIFQCTNLDYIDMLGGITQMLNAVRFILILLYFLQFDYV